MAKQLNDYTDALGGLYTDAPKAVLAAVAVSALTVGGDHLDKAAARVLAEWWALHNAGVVPQRPPGQDPHCPACYGIPGDTCTAETCATGQEG